MTDLEPMEVAALRKLLHGLGGSEDEDRTPVEKAEVACERIKDAEAEIRMLQDRTYLLDCFDGDRPQKRARKVTVMEHLIEKAKQKRSGKTQIRTDTAATLAEVSERTARTYLDEMAEQVPGCHVKKGEEVGDGKALRLDLEAFRDDRSAAEASPPRE